MSKQTLLIVISAVAVFIATTCLYTVDEREKVVQVRLGKIKGADYEPGLHWKFPLTDNIKRYDSRILTLDNPPERFLTLEKKNLNVDFFVKWRIQDVDRYFRATGGDELRALDRLSKIIKDGLRGEFAKRTIQQAVSGEREEIMATISASADVQVQEYGIQIVDVRIKRIDFTDDISGSVYDRMRAERKRVANEFRARGAKEAEKIRADADRQREVILAEAYKKAEQLRGEGDAEATDIYARAYNRDREFYAFYRSLKVYEQAWQDKQDILVLEPDGEFFKYFNPTAR